MELQIVAPKFSRNRFLTSSRKQPRVEYSREYVESVTEKVYNYLYSITGSVMSSLWGSAPANFVTSERIKCTISFGKKLLEYRIFNSCFSPKSCFNTLYSLLNMAHDFSYDKIYNRYNGNLYTHSAYRHLAECCGPYKSHFFYGGHK